MSFHFSPAMYVACRHAAYAKNDNLYQYQMRILGTCFVYRSTYDGAKHHVQTQPTRSLLYYLKQTWLMIYTLQTDTFNKDQRSSSTWALQRLMAQNRQPGRLPDSVWWWVQDGLSARDRASLVTACSRYSLATQVRTVACCFQPTLTSSWNIHKFN